METDDQGLFWLPAEGEATWRVDMEGFVPQTQSLAVEADARIEIRLEAIDVPGSLTGDYRLTVAASPSCVFPAGLFPRKYDAHIEEIARNLYVELSGAEFVGWGNIPGFTGTRDGTTVQLLVTSSFEADYNFVEWIVDSSLSYDGKARGDVFSGRIVASFDGTIDLRFGASASCTAKDHQFELVPIEGGR
jgi:hypothetical protein